MKTQEILDHADNISLEAADDQSQLCNIWPTVKQGLEILKEVIKNPIVKVSITGLIVAGDAIVKRICQ